jgi:hypothetical protein
VGHTHAVAIPEVAVLVLVGILLVTKTLNAPNVIMGLTLGCMNCTLENHLTIERNAHFAQPGHTVHYLERLSARNVLRDSQHLLVNQRAIPARTVQRGTTKLQADLRA